MIKRIVNSKGFTLIEIVVVLAVVAILLTLSIPNTSNRTTQIQIKESLNLLDKFKRQVADSYHTNGVFPADNAAAHLPEADKILGNYLSSLSLNQGAMHLTFGNKAHPLIADKQLSVRPVFVDASPNSPISWVCGYDDIPNGMQASGDNLSNIERTQIPLLCR